ncbi:MAG: hypothetical protein QOJ38_1914 [Solirubrobacterales bacterium]|jgi:hypothetical protein|nr:hypothetical protein [Solirubrobacterales bacterium]
MSLMKKIWIPLLAAVPVSFLIALIDKVVHLSAYASLGAIFVGILIVGYIDPYGGLREPPGPLR